MTNPQKDSKMLTRENIMHLSMSDLSLLSQISSHNSFRSLARLSHVSVSQISKSFEKLENALRQNLAKRSPTGFLLTAEGVHAATIAREVLALMDQMLEIWNSDNKKSSSCLTLGSRGFINAHVAPFLVNLFDKEFPDVGLRFLDFSPEELLLAAFRSAVDFAITLENVSLGERYVSVDLGLTSWVLVARAGHPILQNCIESELKKYPFIRSSYWNGRELISSIDPFPKVPKFFLHESQTAATTVPILLNSNGLSYLPKISVSLQVSQGLLKIIKAPWLHDECKQVYLHANQDTVEAKLLKRVATIAKEFVRNRG